MSDKGEEPSFLGHGARRNEARRGRGRGRGGRGGGRDVGARPSPESMTPTMRMFSDIAGQLDEHHDRNERLVKLSRDTTIESKRIIFLLLRTQGVDAEVDKEIVTDAGKRLAALRENTIKKIAQEILDQDPYRYQYPITPGLEEYIEANCLYYYLLEERLPSLAELQAELKFTVSRGKPSDVTVSDGKPSDATNSDDKPTVSDDKPSDSTEGEESMEMESVECTVMINPNCYILGIGDFTGEMMRRCINSIGSGNMEICHKTADFLQQIFSAYQLVGHGPRGFGSKMGALRQSLQKVENVCYTVQMRGSEVPKHMLADVLASIPAQDDIPE